jgi:hypothetical protein
MNMEWMKCGCREGEYKYIKKKIKANIKASHERTFNDSNTQCIRHGKRKKGRHE